MSVLLACPGCERTQTCTVTGKITYAGKAVSNGLIAFANADDRQWGEAIRPDGTYVCQLPPGEYTVRIDAPGTLPENWTSQRDRPPPLTPRQAPLKYSRFETSKLTAKVAGDKDPLTIDFNLR
jgi:hypothetical protein